MSGQIDPETLLRLILTRIKEWDPEVSGSQYFDADVGLKDGRISSVNLLIEQEPEAALDHG